MSETRVVHWAATAEGGPLRNEPTRFAPLLPALRHRAILDDEAEWQRILERLRVWRAERIEEHALAVVVREGDRFSVSLASSKDEPAALIVGRHERCDALLDSASYASLRHAAVLLWPTSATEVRALAVDLRGESGLYTRHGSARRISSASALHFGAGTADVYALVAARDQPFAVRWPDELEAHLSGALVEDAPQPPPAVVEAWEKSVVLRTGGVPLPPRAEEDLLVVEASPQQIARGVLLGRYDRCRRTQEMAETLEVSRVHAMLFDAQGALWVVDTASSQGTSLVSPDGSRLELGEGRRIARVPRDARVLLADVEVVVEVVEGAAAAVGDSQRS